jgi:hypothetical protein
MTFIFLQGILKQEQGQCLQIIKPITPMIQGD